MKKVLAILMLIGIVAFGSIAVAGSFGPPEKVPVGQSIAYKWSGPDQDVYMDFHFRYASFNMFYAFFLGIYDGHASYSNGNVLLRIYPSGEGFYMLDIPLGEGKRLLLMERIEDNDILVDVVAIGYEETRTARILYPPGTPVAIPSIYSAIYKKHMSHITHEYAYEDYNPVHVCITTGDLEDTE